MSTVLETHGLEKRFGGIVATHAVSLKLARGARHALIGPNGAGKTTLVNLLTGVFAPSSGTITLGGEDITSLAAHSRVRRGLVRTFQISQLFDSLTPQASLMLALTTQRGDGARWWRPLMENREIADEAHALLARFRLGDVQHRPTARLPYGKRRLLEIALALASKPKVLLLDEPVAGVPEAERRDILDTIAALPGDVAILLIEHDMDLVFRFATRVSVLVAGALFAEGEPAEIARDARVKAIYLGESAERDAP